MEPIKIMTNFLSGIEKDPRIGPTHIALFMAIFQCYLNGNCENPVRVFSYELMPIAKMNSDNTYHKRLRELHEYGYVCYIPSVKRNRRSQISLAA